ncbi:hypothetical protein Rsub_02608 [Raphidocelis subcapitata]|uniref:Regulator of MON1-CCZ1 complex N-terminal domain-containing protein n=1 Tax=Raphidocelis subcapitata TaxID=307507 RepID=A0A2V0NQJ7_9CHLO|nr:hypothetical protein Rsub_02608 [Raphidocelis subcapitata]|eukprot:GBF89904.1 hypothetical protein Rsub_02608 [Raphidocelis subcapitata]
MDAAPPAPARAAASPPHQQQQQQQQQQPPPAPCLAHAWLVDSGPDLSHEDVSHLAFDDATGQMLAVKGGHVFAYAAEGGGLRWMYPLQARDGPRVLALRPSLDNRLLAVQRGATLVELVDLASGNCFVHSTHKGRDRILGFFFSEAPGADFVVATDRGLEINTFAARRQGLKLVQRVRRRSDWCIYTHETRMLVLGTNPAAAAAAPAGAAAASSPAAAASPGSGGGGGARVASPVMASWQFTSAGVLHLPLFELHGPLPAAAAAREFMVGQPDAPAPAPAPAAARQGAVGMGSAAPSGGGAASAPASPPATPGPLTPTPPAPRAAAAGGGDAAAAAARRAAAVWLLRMYGRVYLAHAATRGPGVPPQLELYRFYSDTLLLEKVYDLVDDEVELSAVDNALLIHYPSAAVAVVADAALPGRQPLTSPLPLRRLGRVSPPGPGAAAAASPRAASDAMHAGDWAFVAPHWVLDASSNRLARLQLDLPAIAESVSDWPSLVGFLQRRRAPPAAAAIAAAAASSGGGAAGGGGGVGGAAAGGAAAGDAAAPAWDPKALLLGVCRAALTEPLELSALRAIFVQLAYADALSRAGAASPAPPPAAPGGAAASAAAPQPPPPPQRPDAPPAAAAVLAPGEVAERLFCWAHDEEVVDAPYLQAAVSEFCAASEAAGLPPPPQLPGLAVELLLQQGLAHAAAALLRAQPAAAAAPLAERLVAEGACGGGGGGAGGAGGAAAGSGALACRMALDVLARQAAAEARAAARDALPGAGAADGAVGGGGGAAAGGRGAMAAAAAAVAGVPPGAGAAAASAAALARAGRRRGLPHNEAYARQLLASGQALRAARLARDRGLFGAPGLSADELLSAAAAAGDARLFAALHRLLGPRPGPDGETPEGVEAAMARVLAARGAGGGGGSAGGAGPRGGLDGGGAAAAAVAAG